MKNLRQQLEDPEIFKINRMKAHSDHFIQPLDGGSFCQCLDGEWAFSYSGKLEDRPLHFAGEKDDISYFKTIQVPGHMELQGYGTPQYINTLYPWDGVEALRPPMIPKESTPVGTYVRFFDLEHKPEAGGEVFLTFGGVETAFSVWLNGTFVGYSEDSFTPSEFCVTELVQEKGNRLAVEVYKRSSASWIEDQDFWRFSGIFRSVYITSVPAKHVYDLAVRSEYIYEDRVKEEGTNEVRYAAGTGLLSVEARILSDEMPKKEELRLSLGGLAGAGADSETGISEVLPDSILEDEELILTEEDLGLSAYPITMAPRRRKTWIARWSLTVPSVQPWSAESPALYPLELRLADAQRVLQDVGFRTFEMKNGLMCLNGKRIIFRGVNRHEFSVSGGRCISLEEMKEDIRIIKENNMNAVRTCHYPNRTEWYGLCDRAGIYLIDETNLESHGSWQKLGRVEPSWNVPGDLPEWKAAVLDRAESMYERDKNHPAVLIWSLGNESYAGEDIAAMSAYFHEKDSSRLVHYEGCFHRPEYRYISDMESRMYAKPAEIAEYLESELKKKAADPAYVTKPYISCEYMHAMGNSLGGMQLYTELEDQYEGYQGGFIWDYIDQAILSSEDAPLFVGGDFGDRPTDYGFCTNGIVYADRELSPKMQAVRAEYSPIRIDVDEETVTVENRNLFLDTEEYLFTVSACLNGELVEKNALSVNAAPGEKVTIPHGIKLPEGNGTAGLLVRAFRKDELGWLDEECHPERREGSWDDGILRPDGLRMTEDKQEDGSDWYEFAFSQFLRDQGVREPAGQPVPAAMVPGDGYIGMTGPNYRVQFSMTEGGISSLRFGGKELCDRIPRISFWRAMTDNDNGAGYPALMAPWYAAGHFMKKRYEDFKLEPTEGGIRMVTAFSAGIHDEIRVKVTYTAYVDGRILVEAEFPGVPGYPDMPVFAMDLCVPASLDQVSYLGFGPEENYPDRLSGAELGRFAYTPMENLSGYLKPQDCGIRCGVREFTVKDADGTGLTFTAAGEPVLFSVLPFSAYELEEAAKLRELPEVTHTWIRIAADEMGIGGDDSWGAPVHEEYRLASSVPRKLAFWITGA